MAMNTNNKRPIKPIKPPKPGLPKRPKPSEKSYPKPVPMQPGKGKKVK
jgi:hypothetical protein